jgi:hypothetical protein
MGGTCGKHEDINVFSVGKQNGTDVLSQVTVDGKMILKRISG